jgi:membrane protease YdiL (CAAX protease family)
MKYLRQKVELGTSLLLVFPLFLIYQVGVLLVPEVHNGADFVTARILSLLHGQVGAYVALNAGLGLGFLLLLMILRRKKAFDPRLFLPVFIESAIYALTMGTLIVFVMVDILHIDPRLAFDSGRGGPPHVGVFGQLILAIGAGVHEELFFRLILLSGLYALCDRFLGLRKWLSAAIAVLVSSFLFSLAHHIIGGEPFTVGAFVYRLLCGIFFAAIFQYRGFAVAVYTHALYDIYVLLLHG